MTAFFERWNLLAPVGDAFRSSWRRGTAREPLLMPGSKALEVVLARVVNVVALYQAHMELGQRAENHW